MDYPRWHLSQSQQKVTVSFLSPSTFCSQRGWQNVNSDFLSTLTCQCGQAIRLKFMACSQVELDNHCYSCYNTWQHAFIVQTLNCSEHLLASDYWRADFVTSETWQIGHSGNWTCRFVWLQLKYWEFLCGNSLQWKLYCRVYMCQQFHEENFWNMYTLTKKMM